MQMIIPLLEEKHSAKAVNWRTLVFLLKSEQWILTDMFTGSWFFQGDLILILETCNKTEGTPIQ